MRRRVWAGLAIAVAFGAGVIGYQQATTSGPPPVGSANIFVATTAGASPSRCGSPCSFVAANAYGSLSAAYTASSPGDSVIVEGGSYGNQTITRGSHSQTGSVVTFTCATGQTCNVSNGYLRIGNNGGTTSVAAPNHLVFDGINVANGAVVVFPGAATDTPPTDITYKNAHIWCLTMPALDPSLTAAGVTCDTHLFYVLGSPSNVTVQNVEIGPDCCSGDLANVIPLSSTSGGVTTYWPLPTNITFDNIYEHDNYDTCTNFPAALTAQGYNCTGKGFGDTACTGLPCDHVDGFQLEGVNGLTIKNSRIYALNIGRNVAQGMFGETINCQSPCWPGTITIQNNAIASFGTCGFCFDGNGSSHYAGTINILYNTFANFRFDMGDLANGATMNIVGNIFSSGLANGNGGSGWGCTWTPGSGSVTVVEHHNMEPSGKTLCGTGDVTGPPTFVSTTPNTPDLRLSGAQAAINGGEAVFCPATDGFGTARPVSGVCDLGFHEAG